VKLLAEILVSILLHPLAVILAIVNIVQRQDLNDVEKIVWLLLCVFLWGIGPILYVLLARGELW
jgi:hypothetical protein